MRLFFGYPITPQNKIPEYMSGGCRGWAACSSGRAGRRVSMLYGRLAPGADFSS
jgi:hypothetical protein